MYFKVNAQYESWASFNSSSFKYMEIGLSTTSSRNIVTRNTEFSVQSIKYFNVKLSALSWQFPSFSIKKSLQIDGYAMYNVLFALYTYIMYAFVNNIGNENLK